jgi:hypothetical protein
MKLRTLAQTICLTLALNAFAESDRPVARVAVIATENSTATVADLLTVELSSKDGVSVLERTQIEKIQQEQALSSTSGDLIKLSKLLGADGLLILQTIREGGNAFVQAQLVAVKPGVIIGSKRANWPMKDPGEWAGLVAKQFEALYPKLSVLAKDALPVSIVNLRAAVQSAGASELEQELTLMLIARLTHERELFVLERRRLDALSREQEMQGLDESSFWNGSYLIEGTLDRDGFSRENATLHVRLTPPQGGTPVEVDVAARRGDSAALVEQLVQKILQSLRRSPVATVWKPEAEAAKYFDEAKWALKWRMHKAAQVAAESAWALGKRDEACAMVRIKSHLAEVPPAAGYDFSEGFNGSGNTAMLDLTIRQAMAQRTPGMLIDRRGNYLGILLIREQPNPDNLQQALLTLNLFLQLAKNLPVEDLKPGAARYELGVEVLTAASQVLQHFHAVPPSQPAVADKLAEVRARARDVAAMLSKSPSVRQSYFVGDRVATHDELASTIGSQPNLYRCMAQWGCFWQDTPDDCIAIYRELIGSPAYAYLNSTLWFRNLQAPRITAWDDTARRTAAQKWRDFTADLAASTDARIRVEGKMLILADATVSQPNELESAFNELFATILTNRAELVANNVELFYLNWNLGDLVSRMGHAGDVVSPAKSNLERRFKSEIRPQLEAMSGEYWRRASAAAAGPPLPKPAETTAKSGTGIERSGITPSPAKPAPASTPIARTSQASGTLGSRSPTGRPGSPLAASRPLPTPTQPAALPMPKLVVGRFATFTTNRIQIEKLWHLSVHPPRWRDGKVFEDFSFQHELSRSVNARGEWVFGRNIDVDATAIWDPTTDRWDIIPQPSLPKETALGSTDDGARTFALEHLLNTESLGDALYASFSGELRRYDFPRARWTTVPLPASKQLELVAVGGRLYGANDERIEEILNQGRTTKLLASTRRRPASSALDSLPSLGRPALFLIEPDTLAARINGGVWQWDGTDWKQSTLTPPVERYAIANGSSPTNMILTCRTEAPNTTASVSLQLCPPANTMTGSAPFPKSWVVEAGEHILVGQTHIQGFWPIKKAELDAAIKNATQSK